MQIFIILNANFTLCTTHVLALSVICVIIVLGMKTLLLL